jgi:hypothetical protein
MKQGESAIPSNDEPAKAKYTNSGQKNRCLGRVREWSDTISYMKRVRQNRLLSEGQRFEIEFKNKIKQEADAARSRKRKTIHSVNMAAVHELDDVSSISSRASNPTGV